MKKITIIVFIAVLFTACATGGARDSSPGLRFAESEIAARAYIDFSGYSGPSPISAHQPPEGTQGSFSLDNGITGDGLRISNIGDRAGQPLPAPVSIERFGEWMVAYNSNYLYFFIDNPEIREADTLFMNVTFYDDSAGTFDVQYVNSIGHNPNYRPITVSKRGRRNLITTTVQLENCNFNGDVQNQDAQFRISDAARIQRVELILLDPSADNRQTDDDF